VISLRSATRDDIPSVLGFWTEATAEPSTTDAAAGLEALLAHAPGALILAVDGEVGTEAVVGTVIAGWDGWRGALYRLAVAPGFRRRGLATALVAEAEQRLHAHGVRRMHLIVGNAGGQAAVDFWKSANYEGTDQLRMVKNLSRAQIRRPG